MTGVERAQADGEDGAACGGVGGTGEEDHSATPRQCAP